MTHHIDCNHGKKNYHYLNLIFYFFLNMYLIKKFQNKLLSSSIVCLLAANIILAQQPQVVQPQQQPQPQVQPAQQQVSLLKFSYKIPFPSITN